MPFDVVRKTAEPGLPAPAVLGSPATLPGVRSSTPAAGDRWNVVGRRRLQRDAAECGPDGDVRVVRRVGAPLLDRDESGQ